MAKEKNKPVPVRFDLKLMEVLKEEEKIETPQQALNFLAHFWENNRPAKEDFTTGKEDFKSPAPTHVEKPAATKKKHDATGSSSGSASAAAETSGSAPAGLSGIDLSIWKAEQREKNRS
jgi:hypothetical protein